MYGYPIVCDDLILDFFEKLEGYREFPYLDIYNNWTVGIGHNYTTNPYNKGRILLLYPLKDEFDPGLTAEECFKALKKDGISKKNAQLILAMDIVDFDVELNSKFTNYSPKMGDIRRIAILYMAFNMGVRGLLQFRKMINYFSVRKYEEAANEILTSKWYTQVPRASKAVEKMIRNNIMPEID